MAIKTISYSERLGFSKLFRDYIDGDENIPGFFDTGDFESIADHISGKLYDRRVIAEILNRQNRNWGATPEIFDNIEKIKDTDAIAIFTGQQACLFGGPYLILLKAMAAVKYARRLERELSVPVIPIFWIAADDHDFQEVAAVDVFDEGGGVARLQIDYGDLASSPPIGVLKYDDSIAREINRLKELLPDNEFKDRTLTPIAECYRPGEKIVDCFARYLLSILGEHAPILFSPYDEEFKKFVARFLAGSIDRHDEIKNTLAAADSALRRAGYHRQVEKADTAAHLFFHDPNRTAIHRDGERFVADAQEFASAELKEAISSRPIDFSPDVFIRPLMQSHFFPAAAIIGGPAEVAYYAQMMPLFDTFDLVRPRIFARPSLTVVERRFEKLMDEHHVTLDDIAGDFEARINDIFSDTFPSRLDESISRYRSGVMDGMDKLGEELEAYDPVLSGTVNHTRKKVDYLLNELAKKVFAAHKKKNKSDRDRLYRLRDNLFPRGAPAERSIAPAYFISRYGPRIVDFIFENMRLDETGHQLLALTDYDG